MQPNRIGRLKAANAQPPPGFEERSSVMSHLQHRRQFIQCFGAGLAGFTLRNGLRAATAGSGRKLEGVFPIAFSPFTEENKLDLDGLGSQVRFSNRGGVHGFVWPQLASAWSTLSDAERISGAEAILAAGKGGRTALVIGVQAPEMPGVVKYAKHAEQNGADAIISLPPPGVSDEKAILDYYQRVGKITALPLFAQFTGNMSVDLLVEMYHTIPTFRQVKDEAGNPLVRITEIRARTDGQVKVFSGSGVATMMTEMESGFSGHCPYVSLADVYSAAFDLFHKGQHREAFDMFGRIQAMSSMVPQNTIDILIARGVFKEGTKTRTGSPVPGADAGNRRSVPPRMTHEQLRNALNQYLGPYLKG
jgi:4-hydroxy-tetrahydrodipicolinate synthase